MGETVTCLMQQQPFSYTAGISNEAKEGNLISSLGQSVSFGRFTSESLSWEKWSTFSSNKYVEEAEKFSRPGSVAEKKAFFEAHYRNLAARKAAAEAAAALLEQGNGGEMEESEPNEANEPNPSFGVKIEALVDVESVESKEEGNRDGGLDGAEQMEKPLLKVTRTKSKGSARKSSESEPVKADEGREQMERPLLKAMRTKSKGSSRKSNESEPFKGSDGRQQMEEPLLKVTRTKSKCSARSFSKCEPNKANEPNPPPENEAVESSCTKVEALTEVEAIESKGESTNQMEKPLLKDFISNASDSDSFTKKKPAVSFSSNLVVRRKVPAARNESLTATTTPVNKRSSTPKSSQNKAINFTPVREINRITSTIIRKIDCSRAGSSKPTMAKDYSSLVSTPFRTPSREESKNHPETTTPQSEFWARTPLHPSAAASASGSKAVRPRWHFLPTDCSKFMSGSRNKSQQSPCFPTPFSLRTEERAARRKGKLEEKFNANQAQKVQSQATGKV
ncbi:unnamed protein product [Linum tenue]|uniref:TPX2 C-terminal domain-containing protein n=1 Tax=Linum tenue TaxID=586396 RepID=A0AAV0NE72_9ROSI|nr:unnamed protein product [Linum tenue]